MPGNPRNLRERLLRWRYTVMDSIRAITHTIFEGYVCDGDEGCCPAGETCSGTSGCTDADFPDLCDGTPPICCRMYLSSNMRLIWINISLPYSQWIGLFRNIWWRGNLWRCVGQWQHHYHCSHLDRKVGRNRDYPCYNWSLFNHRIR